MRGEKEEEDRIYRKIVALPLFDFKSEGLYTSFDIAPIKFESKIGERTEKNR